MSNLQINELEVITADINEEIDTEIKGGTSQFFNFGLTGGGFGQSYSGPSGGSGGYHYGSSGVAGGGNNGVYFGFQGGGNTYSHGNANASSSSNINGYANGSISH